jgi:phosphohistidine phosphatase SixA
MALHRRSFLGAPLLSAPWLAMPQARAASPDGALRALKAGGVVLAFRHALAPGTFDPPGFKLGDCSTQRNLSEEGRTQARRIGAWLAAQGLKPARVRSSPWCRCMDTATLAFGQAEAWPALGSPAGSPEQTNAAHLALLRQALRDAATQPQALQVWVTHMFVLAALTQENSASGEGLVLKLSAGAGPDDRVQVLARLVL